MSYRKGKLIIDKYDDCRRKRIKCKEKDDYQYVYIAKGLRGRPGKDCNLSCRKIGFSAVSSGEQELKTATSSTNPATIIVQFPNTSSSVGGFNNGNVFNTTNSIFTAPVTGDYQVNTSVYFRTVSEIENNLYELGIALLLGSTPIRLVAETVARDDPTVSATNPLVVTLVYAGVVHLNENDILSVQAITRATDTAAPQITWGVSSPDSFLGNTTTPRSSFSVILIPPLVSQVKNKCSCSRSKSCGCASYGQCLQNNSCGCVCGNGNGNGNGDPDEEIVSEDEWDML